jgi:sRNA-binding protein
MLEAYVERHRTGALTEKHIADLTNELRRLRDEVRASRAELMQLRRSRALTAAQLNQARDEAQRRREAPRPPARPPVEDWRDLP